MKSLLYLLLMPLFIVSLLIAGRSQVVASLPVEQSQDISIGIDSLEIGSPTPAAAYAPHAESSTLNLLAIVRDFKASHPDFQKGITFHTPGLVSETLGPNRKPVFIGANGSGGITSRDTFNQWYNDVPGVNQKTELLLPLTETSEGSRIFTYKNNAFFPIDQRLFGNQGLPHNFHFTLELHTTFVYQGGEVFTFWGDDDVWVFINDQLVVDLGGIHAEISGSIELDTLGLTVGESYPLDLFFAERRTPESHFGLTTSVRIESDPTYAIAGRVTDANSAPLPGAIISIGQGLSTATGSDGRYELTGLPEGSYAVAASKSGYTFTPSLQNVTLPPGVADVNFSAIPTSSPTSTVSIEVIANTADDHFLDTPLECQGPLPSSSIRCAAIASVPLTITVRENPSQAPVQAQIVLQPDETIIGITSPAGLLSSQLAIEEPGSAVEKVVTFLADVSDEPVSSDPLTLYSVESIAKSNIITLTQDEAGAYGRLFPTNYAMTTELSDFICGALLEEVCIQRQVAWLSAELGGSTYTPQAGDVIGEEVFRYTDPNGNVETAYALVQQIRRSGSVIASRTAWSEKPEDFTNRSFARRALVVEVDSAVAIYITDPQGQGAGYDPNTQQIHFDFPAAISATGDEPYSLIVPNPAPGLYTLQISGLESGTFTLDAYGLNQRGQATESQRITRFINGDTVITCTLDYDPAEEQIELACPGKFYLPAISR